MSVSLSVSSFELQIWILARRAVIKPINGDNPLGVYVSSCEHSGVTTAENENLPLVLSFGVISAHPLAIFFVVLVSQIPDCH